MWKRSFLESANSNPTFEMLLKPLVLAILGLPAVINLMSFWSSVGVVEYSVWAYTYSENGAFWPLLGNAIFHVFGGTWGTKSMADFMTIWWVFGDLRAPFRSRRLARGRFWWVFWDLRAPFRSRRLARGRFGRALSGLFLEATNTVFTYIYVKTELFGIRKIEPDFWNVAKTNGFSNFGAPCVN